MRLPAALFDFRTGPAFVVRKLAGHAVLLEIDFPDCLPLIRRGQVKEERAQREAPAQFGWQARNGITSRNEQHPPLGDRVDDLERCMQPFGRSAHQRTLHGRQVESNGGNSRRTARGLCCHAFRAPWWTYKDATIDL